ncbi:MAG: hypothetical protein H3Z52_06740 [archaeon]|nr:hypothetical protein [archaeon]
MNIDAIDTAIENRLEDSREWLYKKYSKTWAPILFLYAKKYHWMLNGSLMELDSFSKSKKFSPERPKEIYDKASLKVLL